MLLAKEPVKAHRAVPTMKGIGSMDLGQVWPAARICPIMHFLSLHERFWNGESIRQLRYIPFS